MPGNGSYVVEQRVSVCMNFTHTAFRIATSCTNAVLSRLFSRKHEKVNVRAEKITSGYYVVVADLKLNEQGCIVYNHIWGLISSCLEPGSHLTEGMEIGLEKQAQFSL